MANEDQKPLAITKDFISSVLNYETHEDRILAAAVGYAKMGLYVVPLRPNSKTLPPKDSGIGYTHASKNVRTVTKWFERGGRFRGWNVGLACGRFDGIFAVDIDINEDRGINGFDSMEVLEQTYGPMVGPYQETPRGGRHYVFKWVSNATSSSDKIGKGIDTRGGVEGSCSSHIVAWPSVVNNRYYEWKEFGEIPETPDWIIERMGDSSIWRENQSVLSDKPPIVTAGSRGNEEVSDTDVEMRYTIAAIRAVLDFINPDDLSYNDWLKIGQAINTQHPGEDGLALWDEFSKRGTRYKPGECTSRWDGFAPNGPVRMGTIIYHAKKGGYKFGRADSDIKEDQEGKSSVNGSKEAPPFDEIIADMNRRYAVVVVGTKVRVLDISRATNPDPEVNDIILYQMQDFETLLANEKVIMTDARGNPVMRSKAALWLADEKRREYRNGVAFHPGMPQEFSGKFNLYAGLTVEPEPGYWPRMRWHIENIICGGNKQHSEWLLDWLADLFQDPANPKGTAIVLKGEEGAGKGTLADIVGKAWGRHYRHIKSEEHLLGRFNAHLESAVLVYADEVVYGGSRKLAGVLRSLVSDSTQIVERKGVDAVSYRSSLHMIIASNEEWFIPAGPQSRRWFVLEVSDQMARRMEYFNDLYFEMEHGGLEAMIHDLLHRPITHNLRTAPVTDLLKNQRGLYTLSSTISGSIGQWWMHCLEIGRIDGLKEGDAYFRKDPPDPRDIHWPDKMYRSVLYDAYESWCLARHKTPASKVMFYRKMADWNIREIKARLPDGSRPRMYKINPIARSIKEFSYDTGVNIDEGDCDEDE